MGFQNEKTEKTEEELNQEKQEISLWESCVSDSPSSTAFNNAIGNLATSAEQSIDFVEVFLHCHHEHETSLFDAMFTKGYDRPEANLEAKKIWARIYELIKKEVLDQKIIAIGEQLKNPSADVDQLIERAKSYFRLKYQGKAFRQPLAEFLQARGVKDRPESNIEAAAIDDILEELNRELDVEKPVMGVIIGCMEALGCFRPTRLAMSKMVLWMAETAEKRGRERLWEILNAGGEKSFHHRITLWARDNHLASDTKQAPLIHVLLQEIRLYRPSLRTDKKVNITGGERDKFKEEIKSFCDDLKVESPMQVALARLKALYPHQFHDQHPRAVGCVATLFMHGMPVSDVDFKIASCDDLWRQIEINILEKELDASTAQETLALLKAYQEVARHESIANNLHRGIQVNEKQSSLFKIVAEKAKSVRSGPVADLSREMSAYKKPLRVVNKRIHHLHSEKFGGAFALGGHLDVFESAVEATSSADTSYMLMFLTNNLNGKGSSSYYELAREQGFDLADKEHVRYRIWQRMHDLMRDEVADEISRYQLSIKDVKAYQQSIDALLYLFKLRHMGRNPYAALAERLQASGEPTHAALKPIYEKYTDASNVEANDLLETFLKELRRQPVNAKELIGLIDKMKGCFPSDMAFGLFLKCDNLSGCNIFGTAAQRAKLPDQSNPEFARFWTHLVSFGPQVLKAQAEGATTTTTTVTLAGGVSHTVKNRIETQFYYPRVGPKVVTALTWLGVVCTLALIAGFAFNGNHPNLQDGLETTGDWSPKMSDTAAQGTGMGVYTLIGLMAGLYVTWKCWPSATTSGLSLAQTEGIPKGKGPAKVPGVAKTN